MNEASTLQPDMENRIISLLAMLLGDQEGEEYDYKKVDAPKEETA